MMVVSPIRCAAMVGSNPRSPGCGKDRCSTSTSQAPVERRPTPLRLRLSRSRSLHLRRWRRRRASDTSPGAPTRRVRQRQSYVAPPRCHADPRRRYDLGRPRLGARRWRRRGGRLRRPAVRRRHVRLARRRAPRRKTWIRCAVHEVRLWAATAPLQADRCSGLPAKARQAGLRSNERHCRMLRYACFQFPPGAPRVEKRLGAPIRSKSVVAG